MDEDGEMQYIRNRPLICRAYPDCDTCDENKRESSILDGGCKNYDLCDNEPAFADYSQCNQDYNEKVTFPIRFSCIRGIASG